MAGKQMESVKLIWDVIARRKKRKMSHCGREMPGTIADEYDLVRAWTLMGITSGYASCEMWVGFCFVVRPADTVRARASDDT